MVSERFCAEDADVIFRSSDDVLFKLHKINLHICAKGFPPPEFESRGEIVELTEPASVLELLFQFVYPDHHPDLEPLEFPILTSLAEAAEKYEVFNAMVVCKIRMKHFVPSHAKEILVYGVKHGYRDVVNTAAPFLISKPLTEMFQILPSELVASWAIYQERWCQVQRNVCASAVSSSDSQFCGHNALDREVIRILERLASDLGSLTELESIFSEWKTCCSFGKISLPIWKASIARDVEKIQSFMPYNV